MNTTTKTLSALAGLAMIAGSADAALLSVDLGSTTNVQTDFTGVASSSDTIGDYDFSLGTVAFFNRNNMDDAGSLTTATLYEDFAYINGGGGGSGSPKSTSLVLSGAGIAENTAYQLTFYSFDPVGSAGTHTVSFSGSAGTTGSAANIVWTGSTNPTTDGQYATTGTFTSDGSGVLTVTVSDSWTGATDVTGLRLNGFVLDVPEPGSLALLGLGGLLIGARRRRG